MDKCTHDVRRANWLNIINQCQERPANLYSSVFHNIFNFFSDSVSRYGKV